MSPLLFLLTVEGLSILIEKAKMEGRPKEVKISSIIRIAHLLFVNDVLLFGRVFFGENDKYIRKF